MRVRRQIIFNYSLSLDVVNHNKHTSDDVELVGTVEDKMNKQLTNVVMVSARTSAKCMSNWTRLQQTDVFKLPDAAQIIESVRKDCK